MPQACLNGSCRPGSHPALPVGVTTGLWAVRGPAPRLEAVEAGCVLAELASVSWHEPEPPRLAAARRLADHGPGAP